MILSFPHPPLNRALLSELSAEEAALSICLAIEKGGDLERSAWLFPVLRETGKVLEQFVQNNLEFSLMKAFQEGRDCAKGIEIEWHWSVFDWMALVTLFKQDPESMRVQGESASFLVHRFKTHPHELTACLEVLTRLCEEDAMWPAVTMDIGGTWPPLAEPSAEQPFWQRVVWELHQSYQHVAGSVGFLGNTQQHRRWKEALACVAEAPASKTPRVPPKPCSIVKLSVVPFHPTNTD